MRHKKRYVAFLVAIIVPGILAAQQDRTEFNHLGIEDGLSQSTVQAILQDSKGYMWFGTQDGLNKYNGYDITVYTSDSADSTRISDNDIRVLYEDGQNRLWVGTQSGGLNLYDRKKDRFKQFIASADPEEWQTLSANSVWSILEDSHNEFWVGTTYGLNRMDRENAVFHRIFAEENNPDALSDNQITVLFEDSNNTLWVGTSNGLNRYNRNDSTFTRFLHGAGTRRNPSSHYIRAIHEDREGYLWIGTEEKGLLKFNPSNGTYVSYRHNPTDAQSLSDNAVFGLLENPEGDLWVATGNGGLNLFDRESNSFTRYRHQSQNPQSLSNDGVNTLYRSREGILWIGTFAGGVDFIDPDPPAFRHFRNEPVNPQSLSNNIVQSFHQDKNGDVWVGTDGGGLNRFIEKTGEFEHFRHRPGRSNTLSADVILDIGETDDGLWLATYGGGVNLLDLESGEIRQFRHNPENTESLSSDFVFVITEKSDGNLWFGTNLGGISILNPETGSFRRYLSDLDEFFRPETIANNDIRAIQEDSNGDMWIGAYGSAFSVYDIEEDRFYHYNINTDSNLYASVVQHIHEDRQGRLWLATRGGGLKQFIRTSGQFITISKADGLPGNIVHAIEEDEAGNLWLSTNNGISNFNPETRDFVSYDLEDGIQSREFNPGSSMRDRDGYIYFGGVNGFNRFHPKDVQADSVTAPVVLTDFLLFNNSVTAASENSPLESHISEAENLVLDHTASVITFEYAALDYSVRKGNQFAYKMEGFDEDWNYVDDLRRATYTNLNSGEYTFRVKVANNHGVWSEAGLSLPITVTPPFWQTTWFLFLMAFILSGMIYLAYRLRVRSIRNRNRRLAITVSKRTAELEKANATKDKLFSIIAHDLINISTGLTGLSSLMKESIEKEDMDEVKEYSVHLHHTISQFATMLKNMLDWARSQTGKIQYEPINFELGDVVKEILGQQESRAIYKNIKLTASVDENLEVHADPDMVVVILRNLIANALKFTGEGGNINVSAQPLGDHIEILVRDDGIGMSEEMIKKIFYRDESVTTLGTSNEKGTGLGISLCKDFVDKNQGSLRIDSKPGEGTTISFTLPVAKTVDEHSGMIQQAS